MRFSRTLTLLATLCFAPGALAGAADVTVDFQAPATVQVYDMARYDLTVSNIGNRNANGVVLQIDLPETATSPSVHVMGTLGAMSNRCSQSGNSLVCDLGRLRKNRSASVWFEISLPVSAQPLAFYAEASTSSNDGNPANDSATHTATVTYYETPVSGPVDVVNRHCTGQGLQGFFECTLFPSSISSHSTTLNADHSITFHNAPPGYTGSWSQVLPDRLAFSYSFNGQLQVAFHGYGVGGSCFEGIALFPTSSYMSAYEVCLQ